jgi:hypothetical protein
VPFRQHDVLTVVGDPKLGGPAAIVRPFAELRWIGAGCGGEDFAAGLVSATALDGATA